MKEPTNSLLLEALPLSDFLGWAQGATKPNILFIAVDDLRPELGCYGRYRVQIDEIKCPLFEIIV